MSRRYHKVALIAIRNNRLLLCRKRAGTALLILPGGCLENGESEIACLQREIHEELGRRVRVRNPTYLGEFSHVAADGGELHLKLYAGDLEGEPEPESEIAELVWFAPNGDTSTLAPSIRERILPDLLAKGLLQLSS